MPKYWPRAGMNCTKNRVPEAHKGCLANQILAPHESVLKKVYLGEK